MAWIHLLGPGEMILTFGMFTYILFKLLPFMVAITVFIGSVGYFYFYLNEQNNYWRKMGIPSPKGNVFYGNSIQLMKDIVNYSGNTFRTLKTNAFGSVFQGVPDYNTTDLDFIKQVLVKEFDSFPDRFDLSKSSNDEDSLRANFLTIKEGDEWRKIRQRCTPAFTSGKMKKLLPSMNHCAKELCEFLEPFAESEDSVPLKDTFSKLTMNVIGRCAFASDFNSLKSSSDVPILYYSKKLFDLKLTSLPLMAMITFPNMCWLYQKITKRPVIQADVEDFFITTLSQVMDQRLKDPESKDKYTDAVQLLLNAMDETQLSYTNEDADIISDAVTKINATKRPLTRMEILAQLLIFLAAGYETTATTLHFVTYVLSLHQDVQDRLRDEINEIMGENDEIGYDDVSKFVYMNAVINESMRLFPPATMINRKCQKDTTIKGVHFAKGTTFTVPIYYIHHSAENYENPEEFIPERFLPEEAASRHPMSFLPFGAGPRICLGMRFAEYELRVTLAWVIKKYKFMPASESPEWPITMDSTGGLLKAKNELKCKIIKL